MNLRRVLFVPLLIYASPSSAPLFPSTYRPTLN